MKESYTTEETKRKTDAWLYQYLKSGEGEFIQLSVGKQHGTCAAYAKQ